MCVNLQKTEKQIEDSEWLFLVTGGMAMSDSLPPNPASEWLPEILWAQFHRLDSLPPLKVIIYCN